MSTCGDHDHDAAHDEEQEQLQAEFRQYASQCVPADFATWSEQDQSAKLAELLAEFQAMKEAQFDAEARLEQSLMYIQQNLPKALPEKFQVLYDPQYWLDSVERPVRRAIKVLKLQSEALTVVADMNSTQSNGETTQATDYSDVDPEAVFQEVCENVYRIPLFQQDFCALFLEFLSWVDTWLQEEGVDLTPPNSMNRYGLILAHVGLQQVLEVLVALVVQPLADAYFPWLSYGAQQGAGSHMQALVGGMNVGCGDACKHDDSHSHGHAHGHSHGDCHGHSHGHDHGHSHGQADDSHDEDGLVHRELDAVYAFIASYRHDAKVRIHRRMCLSTLFASHFVHPLTPTLDHLSYPSLAYPSLSSHPSLPPHSPAPTPTASRCTWTRRTSRSTSVLAATSPEAISYVTFILLI